VRAGPAVLLALGLVVTWAMELASRDAHADGMRSATTQPDGPRQGHIFERAFTPADGLGPDFNATSCVECHHAPSVGGSSSRMVDWVYDSPKDSLGRPSPQFTIDVRGRIEETTRRTRTRRRPPSLLGLGQLEAIPVEKIRARIDVLDADRDGISGRLPIRDDCPGRFGWQSVSCDLPAFIRSALLHELGVVTFPASRRELDNRQFDGLVAFVRQLAAPAPAFTEGSDDLFRWVGCADCHQPATGVIAVAESEIPVAAYTDLLLHEMGPGPRHRATDSRTEFRTAPLWGIGAAGPPYLHDGSARSIDEAIRRHGGEATAARRRFVELPAEDRAAVVRFVATR
jgi:CxxC motif-containing protein (DUF1111 family)